MKDLKSVLAAMDESLINELIYVAQFALCDEDTISRVRDETGIPAARLEAIAGVFIELSAIRGNEGLVVSPCLTIRELNSLAKKILLARAEAD